MRPFMSPLEVIGFGRGQGRVVDVRMGGGVGSILVGEGICLEEER